MIELLAGCKKLAEEKKGWDMRKSMKETEKLQKQKERAECKL